MEGEKKNILFGCYEMFCVPHLLLHTVLLTEMLCNTNSTSL